MDNHRIGLSGSTILSNPEHFEHLFRFGCSHVEIGEFPDEQAVLDFLNIARSKNVTFGVHSPLIRGRSKYDLIEPVSMPVETARDQFEKEVAYLASVGAEYVLVHFPYFKEQVNGPTEPHIEEGLVFLSRLQKAYNIPIVCEPKLGKGRSSCGIDYLHQFPKAIWERYGLSICIDIGDYRMAAKDQWDTFIEPLLPYTRVVHLHNVTYQQNKYFWSVLHPDQSGGYDMRPMIEMLSHGEAKYFIFEHTPHTDPTNQSIIEGIDWVDQLIT
ncbi:TIM barrel protein [Halobacillus salinus]|uniref:TIM barrel protein n=1 Tax=Halobacillus salinus TaxID=192814 RepID=UPI0020CA99CA|nr:TIM barrel protein [Halobacillus salinus]